MAIKPSELRQVLSEEAILEAQIDHLIRQGAREVDGKMFYKASGFGGISSGVLSEIIRRFMIEGWLVEYEDGDTLKFTEM